MNEKENMQVLIANADCAEQEISILDLCYRVLKRWRSILALLLIGAVLGCAAGGLMSAASTDSLPEVDSAERLGIEILRGMYQAYQTQVQKDADSYLMKLDAGKSCYTGTVRYYLDAKAIGGIGLLPELLNIKMTTDICRSCSRSPALTGMFRIWNLFWDISSPKAMG